MPKTMIFLLDGTANDATVDTFSNVYELNQLIAESKKVRSGTKFKYRTQVTFYLPGIGTKFTVRRSVKRDSWFKGVDIVRQQIFGDNLEQIILRAYVNLCANYHKNDSIAIMGFSRGAVAARIFSRLISDFGILTSARLLYLDRLWNEFIVISQIPADAEYFREIEKLQNDLRRQAQQEILHVPAGKPITFLGLFDTVAGEHDDLLSKTIALRDHFPPKGVDHVVHLLSMHDVRKDFNLLRFSRPPVLPSTLREIWMPGVHSDVGGGYQDDFIANVALLTMCHLMEAYGEIAIDGKAHRLVQDRIREKIKLKRIVINPEPSVRVHQSRSSLIQREDEVHPLHWYLVGHPMIYWKSHDQTTQYKDSLNRPADKSNPVLKRQFLQWIA